MALLGVRAGLTNTDAFREAPFHCGGGDVADQSWFRSKLVSGEQYQFAEQVGLGAAVHRGLQLLDAVDGAFDGAGVVGQGQPGDDGRQVAAQPGCEHSKSGKVGIDRADPLGLSLVTVNGSL